MLELCDFLEAHYVEDDGGSFRLKYSPEKTRWAITMPGFQKVKDLHFLVRNEKNKKIMASIMGVPKKLSVQGQVIKVCEVNFLSVHKKLRAKRLAQICIQEMMRRKRKLGSMQAFYTSGHSMPTPFTTVHYMNRFLNVERLIDC